MRPNISKSLYAIGHCRIVLQILIERIQTHAKYLVIDICPKWGSPQAAKAPAAPIAPPAPEARLGEQDSCISDCFSKWSPEMVLSHSSGARAKRRGGCSLLDHMMEC